MFLKNLQPVRKFFPVIVFFEQKKFRNKKGTLKNLDIFEHDCPDGKYAIDCGANYGPIFGWEDIFIDNKWDQRFFCLRFLHYFMLISLSKKLISCFTCRSTFNVTDFPCSYGPKRMKQDESTEKMLAGSFWFQVDDLEVFCGAFSP